jgi:1-acyl-sn-glycerol-3-phosphate acyltransferase
VNQSLDKQRPAKQTLPRFYYFANRLLRHILFPLVRVHIEVTGRENVPTEGGLIVAGNHLSFLDPLLAGVVTPRDLTFMSKIENFQIHPLASWALRNYGAFPVRRGEGDVGAIKKALQVLRDGGALFIAPEGTRSRNRKLGEPHEGLALLAWRSGVPIVPLGISGVEEAKARLTRWKAVHARISIGQPFFLTSPAGKPDSQTLKAMSEAVMEQIAALLPAEYRGRFGELTDNQHYVKRA